LRPVPTHQPPSPPAIERESATEVVRYARRGAAAWITLNRPHAMNAMSVELVAGIGGALDQATADPGVGSVVIAANGPVFCAGADLKAVHGLLDEPGEVVRFVVTVAEMVERVARHPRPVIAAVQGGAIAGGLELALACVLVVAAEDATFSDGHARYGLLPGAGSAARLPRRIGATRAKWLLFAGDDRSAEEMRDFGLVNEVVPAERLRETVEGLTERIGARSQTGLAGMKRAVDAGLDASLEVALRIEREEFEAHAAGADFAEGVSAFAECRSPEFGAG
jgi:enoyl-CoA hydratase